MADEKELSVKVDLEEVQAPADKDEITRDFLHLFHQFVGTQEAQYELVEVIGPHVIELDKKAYNPEAAVADMHQLDQHQQKQLLEFLSKVKELKIEEETGTATGGTTEEQSARESRKRQQEEAQKLFEECFGEDLWPIVVLGKTMHLRGRRPPRSLLLYQSVLTMAVANLEVLIAGLMRMHFELNPKALGEEKLFTLAEIQELESPKHAIRAIATRRVDSLMRDSLEDWAKWFSQRIGIEMTECADDWESLLETFERRHIIVHHAGRVSNQYVARVPSNDQEVGTVLFVSKQYVERALDQLSIAGVVLCVETWIHLRGKDCDLAKGEVLESVYEMMHQERWEFVRAVADKVKDLPGDQKVSLYLRCNAWHARKMVQGISAIEEEVAAWDTSALVPLLTFIRLVILEELDPAFALLPTLLASGELQLVDLASWPILEPMRRDHRYLEFSEGSHPKES